MATIKVYGRITPCLNVSNLVEIQGDRLVATNKLGRRNSQKNALEIGFSFSEIFPQNASQAEVFDRIAKDVIGKFLQGYNGTIFAYGQTGTGKTFTIEGDDLNLDKSPRHGLIPQTLNMIFSEIEKMKDECVSVQISFLEMYNEMAYDLLGPLMYGGNNRKDLPRVLVTHGTSGSCVMHGLSVHDVCSEHEARRLHLKGRCNRSMAWTSNNDRSSRSHAIFMVVLTRQKQGSEIVVKSKLNLVDLAGSERLSKSTTEGQTVNETRSINLSLHHLETVILALQRLHVQGTRNSLTKNMSREELRPKRCKSAVIPEHDRLTRSFGSTGWSGLKSAQSTLTVAEVKRRGISVNSISSYVPYRNSLLTMILQDSLGGNCNTAMIATLSLDTNDMNETISTCRFAQRVARVTNNPVQNKEINEAILIKKLKSQVAKLIRDLADVRQTQSAQQDSPRQDNQREVVEVVDGYIKGRIADPTACGIDSPHKVRACLTYLKSLLTQRTPRLSEEPTSSDEKDSGVGMGCDPSTGGSNENIEEEPSSPTMIGTDSGGASEESIPTPPPVPQPEIVKKHRRDGQLITPPCFKPPQQPPQQFFPDISGHTKDASPETQVIAEPEPRGPRVAAIRETDKQLILLELEIKKEDLIQKSKLLSTALSNQKARIVVMEKHGSHMDELDNERLAEQQLRRKQAEVESLLTRTIKSILDTKAICTTNGVTADQHIDGSGIQGQSSEIDAQVYYRRKLELKERSTRLRLLTCRQKLDRGLMSTGTPENVVSKETESKSSETYTDEGNTRENSPLNSSDESVFSKSQDVNPSNESPPSLKVRGGLPSARAQSSMKATAMENKRKSKFGVMGVRAGSSRQPRGMQVNSPKSARKSYMSANRQSNASPSNGRASRQYGALPSNVRSSRPSYVLLSNGRPNRQFRVSPSNNQGTSGERQGHGKNIDHSRAMRQAENPGAMPVVVGPVSLRSRRPATCSPVMVTNKRPIKRPTRPCSSNVHYEYDHNKGFIVRTNEDVYRASNFHQPVPSSLSVRIRDIKGSAREKPSPSTSSESPNEEPCPNPYDDVTPVSRDRQKLPPIVSDVTKEDKNPTDLQVQDQRSDIESERAPQSEVPKSPETSKQKKPIHDNEPKRDVIVQRLVSPTVISARKQQIERARRIRQVTSAVEVIQDAYRRYLWRKRKRIQPASE